MGAGWRNAIVSGAVAAGLASLVACSADPVEPDGDDGDDVGPPISEVIDDGCSTAVVLGLSQQIVAEVECMAPGMLASFSDGGGIVFAGGALLPLVSVDGLEDLLAAVDASTDDLRITSAYRTVAQQFLLQRWFAAGRCGLSAVATPGNSNHESGRALDIDNHEVWASQLPDFGWQQTVLPADPVHFEHLASADARGMDVLSFQRLWNRNRPDDPIDEDGDYGPETEARIELSPSGGFAIGPDC